MHNVGPPLFSYTLPLCHQYHNACIPKTSHCLSAYLSAPSTSQAQGTSGRSSAASLVVHSYILRKVSCTQLVHIYSLTKAVVWLFADFDSTLVFTNNMFTFPGLFELHINFKLLENGWGVSKSYRFQVVSTCSASFVSRQHHLGAAEARGRQDVHTGLMCQLWTCRVLVGAPRANSSFCNSAQITEPGAMFKCNLEGDVCEEVIVDRSGKQWAHY